jgi:hypothetical protein
MANISLYVSGQTELNDVTEFFQKRLIGEGETPIAFFDGVFYESHQERVGNIVFQDYLIYTDKAIYLWARGTSKDFLDRFTLGAVSVNSRNKDSAFATLNLKIKREGKEPVYVIFDMVEIQEAETIVKLHTVIESTIEDYLGVNFRQEIPQEIANRILQTSRNICPPRSVSIVLEAPEMPVPDAGIGYGQDLLEQYKASIGYSLDQDPQQQQGAQPRQRGGIGMPPPPPGLEGILPTDPAAIKRIAGQLKDMVGDAPFKLREQVMKDLQHVPNDVATVLTALNELLVSIAGNPQAERFVMNAIKTAVSNDGLIGSVGKIIKLTSGIGGGKKPSRSEQASSRDDSSSRQQRGSSRQDDSDDDSTIRRRKISVRDDNDQPGGFDPFRDEETSRPTRTARDDSPDASARRPMPDDDDDDTPRRKKLSIKAEDDGSSDIARKLMSYDESEREQPSVSQASASRQDITDPETAPRRKKLSIKAEDDGSNDIARKLMSYDESERDQLPVSSASVPLHDMPDVEAAPRKKKLSIKADTDPDDITRKLMSYDEEPLSDSIAEADPEPQPPVRKKIQIKAPEPDATFSLAEELRLSDISEGDSAPVQESYLTLESDLPIEGAAKTSPKGISSGSEAHKAGNKRKGAWKDEGPETSSDSNSFSVKPTP